MILALDDFDAFRSSEFQTSLLVGVCALVVGALSVSRRRSERAGRLLGSVVTLAWGVSVVATLDPPEQLIAGLALLFAAGLLHDVARVPFAVAVALGSVGAWVTATGGDFLEMSAPVVFVLIVAVGTAITAFASCEHSAAVVLPFFTVTVGGLYATLPDTEWVIVAIGAFVPLLLLAQPGIPLRLGAAGSFVATGLLVSTIAMSWGGRESAVVGAVGSLGLVIVVPLAVFTSVTARLFWRERLPIGRIPWALGVLVAHVGLVLICAHGAGLRGSVAAALMIAVAALGVAWVGLFMVAGRVGTRSALA